MRVTVVVEKIVKRWYYRIFGDGGNMCNRKLRSYTAENGWVIGRRVLTSKVVAEDLKYPLDVIRWAGARSFFVVKVDGVGFDTFFARLNYDHDCVNFVLRLPDGKKVALAWGLKLNHFVVGDDYNYLNKFHLDLLSKLHKYCYEYFEG